MNQTPFLEAGPFFVLRTALWPFTTFTRWSEGLAPSPHGPEEADAAAEDSAASFRARLQELVQEPLFREALFLASPDLIQALPLWYRSPLSAGGSRVERSVVKYFARMCGRATPFGLFAGTSIGRIGTRTCLETLPPQAGLRHIRPDMDFLGRLAFSLGALPDVARMLAYSPNTSLYSVAGRMHYYEARFKGNQLRYHLVAVDATGYLQAVLAQAARGALFDDLAASLVSEEIGLEEAEAFIQELVHNQILLPLLEPATTGPEPLAELFKKLSAIPHPRAQLAAGELGQLKAALAALDATPIGTGPGRLEELVEQVGRLPVLGEAHPAIQVDLLKPAPKAELGGKVLAELESALTVLWKMEHHPADPFRSFKAAFRERYGQREVPLVDVLDQGCGLGFGSPEEPLGEDNSLIAGLPLEGAGQEAAGPAWGPWETWLCQRLLDSSAKGEARLELTAKDLEPFFSRDLAEMPPTLSVMVELAAKSQADLHAGRFGLFLMGGSGPSSLNIMGRFCHADPELTGHLTAFLRREESHWPDAIHAEIVHLPEGRAKNIVLRPTLREYEIPFLGRSGLDPDHQLPITDLLVSLNGERILLRSRRLGKEVVPWLTNAHAHQGRPFAIYRFLCQLQYQGRNGNLGWDWGALGGLACLPRVVLGRTVLSKARWLLRTEEIKAAMAASSAARMQEIHRWMARKGLPRFMLLVDGDNKLPLDLQNPLSVDAFLDLAKGRTEFTLMEFYPSPDELGVRSSEGGYVHEILVPFVVNRAPQFSHLPGTATASAVRHFPPGSEWLYGKIYTGHAGADSLLRSTLPKLVDQALAAGGVDRWFFLRYGDPHHHLRLRFHGDPEGLLGQVLPHLRRLLEPHLESGLVTSFQLGMYEPEWERYGGLLALPCCEQIFQADSESVLAILEQDEGGTFKEQRWRLALASSDRLLQDFGYQIPDRLRLMTTIRDGFRSELKWGTGAGIHVARRFRQERGGLEELLWDPARSRWQAPLSLLDQRSRKINGPAVQLRSLAEVAGGPSLDGILASLLHMSCNRFLKAAQRPQELVIAEFLVRAYQGHISRHERGLSQAGAAARSGLFNPSDQQHV